MKKFKFISLIALAGLSITGCAKLSDFKFPTSVAVKTTKADYNFTVLDLKDSDILSKNINFADMLNQAMPSTDESSDSTQMQMYLYNPNGTAESIQMAMRMELQKIPLDFSQYFQNADFEAGLGNMEIEKEIPVPEMSQPVETIQLEVDDISPTVNKWIKYPGEATGEWHTITIPREINNGFDKLKYKSGSLIVQGLNKAEIQEFLNIAIPDIIPETTLGGTVSIKQSNSTEPVTYSFVNGKAVIPLTDFEFVNGETSIKIDDPEINEIVKKYFIMEIAQESKLDSAEGLTLSEPISFDIPEQTIELSSDDIKYCKIDEGKLSLKVLQPENWKDVALEYNVVLTQNQEELLSIDQSDEAEGKSLKNLAIKFENFEIKGSANIKLNNSTVDFTQMPFFQYGMDIDRIAEAEVVMNDSFNPEPVNMNEELPEEVLNYIKKIVWGKSGVIIEYSNTLPENNDILIKISSKFLGLENQEYKIETGESEEPRTIEILCQDEWPTPLGKNAGEFSAVDFNAELEFGENFNKEANTLKIYGIESNKNYKISMTVKPEFNNWQAVYINSDVANQSSSLNTGVNLGSILGENEIFKNFADKIELTTVPIRLYCDIPPIIDGIEFKGKIKAYLADEKTEETIENTEQYLLGTEDDFAVLVSKTEPELTKNEAGELTTVFPISGSSVEIDDTVMAKIINTSLKNKDGVLGMDYSIGMNSTSEEGSIKILKENFESLKNSDPKEIKISAVVILPLEFNVSDEDGLNIDFASLLKSDSKDGETEEKDLLQRSSDNSTMNNISQYLEAIENVGVTLNISKMPFKTENGIKFVIDLDGDERSVDGETRGDKFEPQALVLPEVTLDVDVKKLLETNPLVPTYSLNVPKGKFSILRDMNISVNAKLKITTKDDCLIPLDFGSGSSESK